MTSTSEGVLCVAILESTSSSLTPVRWRVGQKPQLLKPRAQWDPPSDEGLSNGERIAEELARQYRALSAQLPLGPTGMVVSMPGTLDGSSTVLSSKRLGIVTPVDLPTAVREAGGPECKVFHDTECLAVGEAYFGALRTERSASGGHPDFCYVFVDEGIGSKLFIGGVPVVGAGSAGHLGRLVVQPDGAYSQPFSSRGPLEVYASRPWVSSNMVGMYRAERGKTKSDAGSVPSFRRALNAASESEDWTIVTYKQMAEGIEGRDLIATAVLEEASSYLGLAINAIITIVHPPAILLGGGMISELPEFARSVIGYARRFSWELAWNRTKIVLGELGRVAQIYGAARCFLLESGQESTTPPPSR